MRLVCCLLLLLAGCQLACAVIRVGAWNIQGLGVQKAANANIMGCIATVIRTRYDIVVIQEVLDPNNANPISTALLNRINNAPNVRFRFLASNYLGEKSTTHRERYVYFYNSNTVTLVDNYHYPQPARPNAKFDRTPFIAKFRSIAGGYDFAMIPLHSKPEHAPQEINSLFDVVTNVSGRAAWNANPNPIQDRILLLGDFNAGTRYVPLNRWPNIRLRQPQHNFHWLIEDWVPTNVLFNQAHDRIVATAAMVTRVAPPAPPEGDAFHDYPNLCALPAGTTHVDISDHFPVEVQLL